MQRTLKHWQLNSSSKCLSNSIIIALLIVSQIILAYGQVKADSTIPAIDECQQQKLLCEEFEKDKSGLRFCDRNKALFIYSEMATTFIESRKHCARLFENNPRAGLIQINKNIKNSFLKYMDDYGVKNGANTAFFTSGLCCLKRDNIHEYECLWEPNGPDNYIDLKTEHDDGCHSVTAVYEKNNFKLEAELKMYADDAKNFYCQLPFLKDKGCPIMPPLITDQSTTTEEPTTTTEKPTTTEEPTTTKRPTTTEQPTTTERPTTTTERLTTPVKTPAKQSAPDDISTPKISTTTPASTTTVKFPTVTTTAASTTPTTTIETKDDNNITTTTVAPILEVVCPAQPESHGISGGWPSVKANQISRARCPSGFRGTAEWLCSPRGIFDPNGPNITCTNMSWYQPLYNEIISIASMENISKITNNVDQKIKEKPITFAQELSKMTKLLEQIQYKADALWVPDNHHDNRHMIKVASNILNTCSYMINQTDAWRNGNQKQVTSIASSILRYVQYSSFSYACSDRKMDNAEGERKMNFNDSNFYISEFNLESELTKLEFSHSFSAFKFVGEHFEIVKNNTVSRRCDHKIAIGSVISKLARQINSIKQEKDTKTLNSEIVAFNMNNQTSIQLGENWVSIRLKHGEPLQFGSRSLCVFFNFESQSWVEDGCYKVEEESDIYSTVCRCNHLTNFAVLLDISGTEKPSLVKSIMTIVCSSTTIVSLVITLFIHYHCRDLRDRRGIILMNLSVSLIVLHTLLLFGLDQTAHSEICQGVSVGLMYSLFASFAWMSMEGYQLFKQFFYVFEDPLRIASRKLYLICYGVPMLITGGMVLWIVYSGQKLTNDYFCWISNPQDSTSVWIIAILILVVISLNSCVTIFMIYIVHTTKKSTPGLPSRRFVQQSQTTQTSTLSNGDTTPQTPSTVTGSFFKTIANGKRSGAGKTNKLVNGSNNNKNYGSRQESTVENWESVKKQLSQNIRYVWAYLPIIFVLGFTWLSFVLYINAEWKIFSYVFIVLNGLQGFFIFLTRIVFARKAKDSIARRLRRSRYSHVLASLSTSNSRTTDSTALNSNSSSMYS